MLINVLSEKCWSVPCAVAFLPSIHTITQRSVNIHTTTTTHAQQHKQEQIHTQPSSERSFEVKTRSRRETKEQMTTPLLVMTNLVMIGLALVQKKLLRSEEKSKRKPTVRVVFRLPGRRPVSCHRGIQPCRQFWKGFTRSKSKRTAEALSKRWITS
jgi:hypothetical protein